MTICTVTNNSRRSLFFPSYRGKSVGIRAGQTRTFSLFGRNSRKILSWERSGLIDILSQQSAPSGSLDFSRADSSGRIVALTI